MRKYVAIVQLLLFMELPLVLAEINEFISAMIYGKDLVDPATSNGRTHFHYLYLEL